MRARHENYSKEKIKQANPKTIQHYTMSHRMNQYAYSNIQNQRQIYFVLNPVSLKGTPLCLRVHFKSRWWWFCC